MPRELLEFYTGVRGFDVVRLDGYEDFRRHITEETDLFNVIKALASEMDSLGWTPQNAGNISIRETPHHTNFTITASGSNFSDIQLDDIVHVAWIGIVIGRTEKDEKGELIEHPETTRELHIGSNYGIEGEFNLYRICEALDELSLLGQMKTDLGVEFTLPKPGLEADLLVHGNRLVSKLNEKRQVAFDELSDYRLKTLATEYSLSEQEVAALREVFLSLAFAEAIQNMGPEFKQKLDRVGCKVDKERLAQGKCVLKRINEKREKKLEPRDLNNNILKSLADTNSLSGYDIDALRVVHHYQGDLTPYKVLVQNTRNANLTIQQSGLTLKRMVSYLGEKELIRCKVYAICPPGRKPSSEALLHGLIYSNRWEGPENVNAIVHCHAPNPTLNPPEPLRLTETSAKICGYGTLEIAVEALESVLPDHGYTTLRDHGPVVVTGNWQEWIRISNPRCQKMGVFRLDSSYAPIFKDAFNKLRNLDARSQKG
ncbi:class II aldolase/adducin family protein [Candidatus Woesearchaeota archaeon]|nr:class II aldolase/adducin family protein [Candidatus Woesearchaeota archaeon]MBW3022196.1 class II aldolase/adducin family protein [Candidatus Woesearchaeota archaeon]